MTLTFFFPMFCSLSGISLSWKTLVFGRFTSQERTNVHRTAFFLHTPDFSLSKVTALKVAWGKDTSRRSKEPGSDLPLQIARIFWANGLPPPCKKLPVRLSSHEKPIRKWKSPGGTFTFGLLIRASSWQFLKSGAPGTHNSMLCELY